MIVIQVQTPNKHIHSFIILLILFICIENWSCFKYFHVAKNKIVNYGRPVKL